MFKRFMSYYRPHKKLFAMDMAASCLVSLIAVLYPILTRYMLNDLFPSRNGQMLVLCGAALLLLYTVRMLLNYFIHYQGHVMGVRMQARMRSDLFNHLQRLPVSFYDKHETGKIMSRLTHDISDITELAHHGPETIIISSISVIVSFVYLCTIYPPLALIIFGCVPFLILVSILTRKKMMAAFKKNRLAMAEINASLENSVGGIRVTKAFGNSKKESEKFEVGNEAFQTSNKAAFKALGEFHALTTFITDVFNVVTLVAGGLFLYFNKISFADYSAFIVSINLFLNPITTLIRFMEQFQNGATGFERFVEVMDMEPETDADKAVPTDRVLGKIDFCDVTYGYGDERDVLRQVSLTVEAGKTFALVGPSGGGKTTICHLIPRFYNVRSGQILIDGQPIEDITLASLRSNVGIVQQDVYLFNASVRDNILYGRLTATEDEVIEAAKRANIHEYIMSLPDGYDTVVGERGVRLSGGQKQRLCIARVFLKNPPILILDEATSALDTATEMLIQEALDELCIGRTTIVVAHRLSTVRRADTIAVVSDGQIIETGDHDSLLQKNGIYADLYHRQFQEE